MDMGTVRGLIALITMGTFLGICWWAYRGKNRARFEEDGLMPFADDEATAAPETAERVAGESLHE